MKQNIAIVTSLALNVFCIILLVMHTRHHHHSNQIMESTVADTLPEEKKGKWLRVLRKVVAETIRCGLFLVWITSFDNYIQAY